MSSKQVMTGTYRQQLMLWTYLGLLALAGCGGGGGGNKSGASAPAASPDSGDAVADESEADPTPAAEEAVPLAIAPERLDALKVPVGTAATIRFRLSGDDGQDVYVGLTAAPTGMKLAHKGSAVTVTWDNPTAGPHDLVFVLRSRTACEAAEAVDTVCAKVDESVAAGKPKAYDVTSEAFTLDVGDVTPVPAAGAGGLGSITDLLGANAPAGLAGILAGLSGGQLSQVADLLKGGFDINTILGMLGGLTLTDDGQGTGADTAEPQADVEL